MLLRTLLLLGGGLFCYLLCNRMQAFSSAALLELKIQLIQPKRQNEYSAPDGVISDH